MPAKTLLLISSLLVTGLVYAIPPPDALVSIWQSLLQILGVASVFIAGGYYSLKQYFGVWKLPFRRLAIIAAFIGIGFIGYSYFYKTNIIKLNSTPPKSQTSNTANDVKPSMIQGELISIEEVIQREPDDYTRNWKLETYNEMLDEANFERQKSNLSKLPLQTISSFTPQALFKHMQESPEDLFFLDVRGPYERKMFHLPYQASAHYGDFLHDIVSRDLKLKLPSNKRIIVLCHSGLRGYIAANVLANQGISNVSFLQGGLANWNKQKLPIEGDENYSLNLARYSAFSEFEAKHVESVQKIEIDPGEGFVKDMFALESIPYEVTTTEQLKKVIEESKRTPVLIICRSYTGCFHTLNFGYMIEQAGGRVAGVFDRTGEFVIHPNGPSDTLKDFDPDELIE